MYGTCVQCSEVYLLWYSRQHVDYGLPTQKVGDEALESLIKRSTLFRGIYSAWKPQIKRSYSDKGMCVGIH